MPPEPSLADQIATLNSTLGSVERRLAVGQNPVEGLENFKSALDDMRLRLWGLVSAVGGGDYRGFQERFRIRRATEMCQRLSGDLHSGAMSAGHRELSILHDAAAELGRSIELARQQAF
jgi:hypothetical protein